MRLRRTARSWPLLLLLGMPLVHAADIRYEVDRSIGVGNVTGHIVTDGRLGLLQSGNILNWSLRLDDGAGVVVLDNTNSHTGGALPFATADALSFDLDAGNFFGFINNGITTFDQMFWCLQGQQGQCTSGAAREAVRALADGSATQFLALSGRQVIAMATPVPEPGTVAMLTAGLLLIGTRVRSRRSV